MSNAKHTHGPWKFLKRGMLVTQDETKIVGTFHKASDNDCDDELLIAAAPELFAALEALASIDFGAYGWDTTCECIAIKARAAIAKARGE